MNRINPISEKDDSKITECHSDSEIDSDINETVHTVSSVSASDSDSVSGPSQPLNQSARESFYLASDIIMNVPVASLPPGVPSGSKTTTASPKSTGKKKKNSKTSPTQTNASTKTQQINTPSPITPNITSNKPITNPDKGKSTQNMNITSPVTAKRPLNVSPEDDTRKIHKKQNIRTAHNPNTNPTVTKNRFDVLTDTDEDDITADDGDENPTTETEKNILPTPVVIPEKPTNTKAFIDKIKYFAKTGFHVKYNTNNVTIFFKSKTEKDKYLQYETNYYTFTDKTEKTHAFVLRGLDSEPTTDEVRSDLQRLGIIAKNVHKMRTPHRPLYLVITQNNITLKSLQTTIKFILHTKITWERHENKKKLTQCHRCQLWGHATSNCHLNPNCLKCGCAHWTRDCTKPVEENATCFNCKGDHPANSTNCPVYKKLMEHREKAKETRTKRTQNDYNKLINNNQNFPKLLPAPPPTTNVWAERALRQNNNISPAPQTQIQTQNNNNTSQTIQPANINQINSSEPKDMINLIEIIKQINQKVNIKNMLTAMTDLNSQLNTAQNKNESIQIFLTFLTEIEKYNI